MGAGAGHRPGPAAPPGTSTVDPCTVPDVGPTRADSSELDDAELDDAELVARVVAGDADAFATLARRHRRLLDPACATACADHHDREDALQEALVDIWRGLPGFDGRSKATTWMFTVAQNAARRHTRRSARHVVSDNVAAIERSSPSDDWTGAVVTRAAVIDAVDALADDHRDALILHTQAGMSLQEIAEVKYAAVGTVKSWLHRGRAEIARSLATGENP